MKEAALDAFNEFGMHPDTRNVPAILMLGEKQTSYQEHAKLSEHRVALAAPLKLKEFREAVERIVRR